MFEVKVGSQWRFECRAASLLAAILFIRVDSCDPLSSTNQYVSRIAGGFKTQLQMERKILISVLE